MRLELAVSHEVSVELVAANPLKASVEPVKGAPGPFDSRSSSPFSSS